MAKKDIREIILEVGDKVISQAKTFSYPEDNKKTYKVPTYLFTVSGTDDKGKPQSRDFECIRFGVAKHNKRKNGRVSVVGWTHTKYINTIRRWNPNYTVHSADSLEKGAWNVKGNFLVHDGPDDPKVDVFASLGCVEICGKEGFVKMNRFMASLSGSKKPSMDEKLMEMGQSGKLKITYAFVHKPPLIEW